MQGVAASLVWTCAQLHYLTKRQQRNVDNETTYKTSAMKQPKRSGLAWSHGRDAALLRAVSSRSSTTGTWWSLASALPCLQGLQYRTQCAGAWQLASIEASATQHRANRDWFTRAWAVFQGLATRQADDLYVFARRTVIAQTRQASRARRSLAPSASCFAPHATREICNPHKWFLASSGAFSAITWQGRSL